jgi:tartrate dehydrogenase/decarboxylase/D-malate dehydrogenase
LVIQESVFSRHGSRARAGTPSSWRAAAPPHAHRGHQEQRHRDQHALVGRGAAEAVHAHFPEVRWDKQHIDILAARFVLQPQRFDVVVATNLFGDILSTWARPAPAPSASRPSANLNPERTFPSLFEPVHGSAPDIYGQNIANPWP